MAIMTIWDKKSVRCCGGPLYRGDFLDCYLYCSFNPKFSKLAVSEGISANLWQAQRSHLASKGYSPPSPQIEITIKKIFCNNSLENCF